MMEDTKRSNLTVRASFVGIACNAGLFAVKLSAGLLMHSVSIVSDAFNSLSDASSNIISLVGMKMSGKPADKEHPFGHGRIEYMAAWLVSMLILVVGFSLFRESVSKIRAPRLTVFAPVPFALLLISIGVKLWMARYYRGAGKQAGSGVLLAAAADARNDALVTSAAVAAVLLERGLRVPVDGIAGLLVSIFVMYSGLEIAKNTAVPLIGGRESPELVRRITHITASQEGVLATHDLVIHDYGPGRHMATIHAELPDSLTFEEAHKIADEAEREVLAQTGVRLVVHADPVNLADPEADAIKKEVAQVLHDLDTNVTFHDFRIVRGTRHLNLIFDVVLPFSYDEGRQREFLGEVAARMRGLDDRYHCHITCDQPIS